MTALSEQELAAIRTEMCRRLRLSVTASRGIDLRDPDLLLGAADAIDALAAENARLKLELGEGVEAYRMEARVNTDNAKKIVVLRNRVARLEAAAGPFARIALTKSPHNPNEEMIDAPDLCITPKQVRALAAALAPRKHEDVALVQQGSPLFDGAAAMEAHQALAPHPDHPIQDAGNADTGRGQRQAGVQDQPTGASPANLAPRPPHCVCVR